MISPPSIQNHSTPGGRGELDDGSELCFLSAINVIYTIGRQEWQRERTKELGGKTFSGIPTFRL